MPAKKKSVRARKPRPRAAARDSTRDRLAAGIPTSVRSLVQEIRSGLRQLERQVAKQRALGGRRFDERQRQLRRDLAGLLRRVERAIEPGARAPGRRKASARRESTARAPKNAEVD